MTSADAGDARERHFSAGTRPRGLVTASIARLRDDPRLLAPFLLAGAFLTAVDWLRARDPIPAGERASLPADGIEISVEFVGYPTGVRQTRLLLDPLVGLQPRYLLWVLGLHLLGLAVVSAAGTLAIARATDADATLGAGLRYGAYVAALEFVAVFLASIDVLQGMGLVGVVPLALVAYAFVRLFAAPGFLVAGRSVRVAVRQSARHSRGSGWGIFGLVLLIGLGAWLLAFVPLVGTAASTAVAGSFHAVAIVVFLERQ